MYTIIRKSKMIEYIEFFKRFFQYLSASMLELAQVNNLCSWIILAA